MYILDAVDYNKSSFEKLSIGLIIGFEKVCFKPDVLKDVTIFMTYINRNVYGTSYIYTYGAGSHAEIYATNKALLVDPLATADHLLIYVNKTGGVTSPVVELPLHTCPHCEYILNGFNILSDIQ